VHFLTQQILDASRVVCVHFFSFLENGKTHFGTRIALTS
jgi:hypothetical protein